MATESLTEQLSAERKMRELSSRGLYQTPSPKNLKTMPQLSPNKFNKPLLDMAPPAPNEHFTILKFAISQTLYQSQIDQIIHCHICQLPLPLLAASLKMAIFDVQTVYGGLKVSEFNQESISEVQNLLR